MVSMITAKILFYNTNNGTGLLIDEQGKKYSFSVEQWEDFNTMPSTGEVVDCMIQNDKVISLKATQEITQKQRNKPQQQEEPQQELKTAILESLQSKKPQNNHKITKESDLEKLLTSSNSSNLSILDKKIVPTSDIDSSIKAYIDEVNIHLTKRMNYKKIDGRLDYQLAKRFLWTTYNNLKDIDSNIITPKILLVEKDLHFMDKLYENFTNKTTSSTTAFEELFLSVQTDYQVIKNFTKKSAEKLKYLKQQEQILKVQRDNKNALITETKDKKQRNKLNDELKTLNGTYVDIVHMMAKIEEIQTINKTRLKDFEAKYRAEFDISFKREAKKYKDIIKDILNAQAFYLDFSLWREAKISKDIRTYFKKLSLNVELNTKTYLKYYLSTLDETKSSQTTKELTLLYDHLCEIYKEYIVVLCSSAQEAMEYEQSIKSIDKSYNVKSFIDEKSCIKFSMIYSIKLIVIEEKLRKTDANSFLNYFHSHIISKPKILYIGNTNPKYSSNYHIDKKLPANVSGRVVATSVKDILDLTL